MRFVLQTESGLEIESHNKLRALIASADAERLFSASPGVKVLCAALFSSPSFLNIARACRFSYYNHEKEEKPNNMPYRCFDLQEIQYLELRQ